VVADMWSVLKETQGTAQNTATIAKGKAQKSA